MEEEKGNQENKGDSKSPVKNEPVPRNIVDGIISNLPLHALNRLQGCSPYWYIKCNMVMNEKEKEHMGSFAVFPKEILQHIFSKIPAKTLLNLKCLNKGWQLRIDYHIRQSKSMKRKVLLPSYPLKSLRLWGHSLVDHPRSTIEDGHNHVIVGSLEGMVLMVNNKHYTPNPFFCNPATNNVFHLPRLPAHTESQIGLLAFDSTVYGLGYDKSVLDVKVVVLSRSRAYEGMLSQCFSLSTKSWNRIPYDLKPISISSIAGSFVEKSRRLFWIARYDKSGMHFVLSLDLNSMLFDEIAFIGGVPIQTLGTIGGNLCALVFMNSDDKKEEQEEEEDDDEEEEEEEEEEAEAKVVLPLDEELWSTERQGIYEVHILEGGSWKSILQTSSLVATWFGEFYILTFLDRGGVLLKAVNNETRDRTILLCDLAQGLGVEVKQATTFLVGNTHASEYDKTVDDFPALLSLPCFGPPADPVTPPSRDSSSHASSEKDPDPGMTLQFIQDLF